MTASNNQQIWRGLIDYANEPDLESKGEALEGFAKTLSDSMPWMARTVILSSNDVPEMIAVLADPETLFAQNDGKRIWLCLTSQEQLVNKFRQQAIEYQPQVRRLLTWLSDRKKNEENRSRAFAFLLDHTRHIEFQRGDPGLAPEEEQDRYFTPKGDLKDDFPHRTLLYKDLADVICDFVQREHEARRSVPIHVCNRPGCGNLVVQFKKRRYCRTPSCDRERQKRDNDLKQQKNRDGVFVCRLRKMQSALRRKRARESAERLRQIQTDWRDKNESLARHASKLLEEIR